MFINLFTTVFSFLKPCQIIQYAAFLCNFITRFNIIFSCTLNFVPFKLCNLTLRCVLHSPPIFTYNPVPAHSLEHSESRYIPHPSSRITLCLHTRLNTPNRATFPTNLHVKPCTFTLVRTLRIVLHSPPIFTFNPVPAHSLEHSESCYIPHQSSRITLCLHTR